MIFVSTMIGSLCGSSFQRYKNVLECHIMPPTNFILPKKQAKLENYIVFTLAGFGQQMWQFDMAASVQIQTYICTYLRRSQSRFSLQKKHKYSYLFTIIFAFALDDICVKSSDQYFNFRFTFSCANYSNVYFISKASDIKDE